MAYCGKCGTQSLEGASFCAQCGQALGPVRPPSPAQEAIVERRRSVLRHNVQQAVEDGLRVEVQSEYSATLVSGHRVNHILHLLLSVFTLGAWLIVWLIVSVVGGEKRSVISVDEAGVAHFTHSSAWDRLDDLLDRGVSSTWRKVTGRRD